MQRAAVGGPQRPGHLSQTQTAPVSLSACLSTFTCTILYVLANFSSRVTTCPPVCTGDNPVQRAAVSGPQRPGHLSQTQTAPVSLSACLSTFTCTILYVLANFSSRVTTCPPVCTGDNPVQRAAVGGPQRPGHLSQTQTALSVCLSVYLRLSVYLCLYHSLCSSQLQLQSNHVSTCVYRWQSCAVRCSQWAAETWPSLSNTDSTVCLPIYVYLYTSVCTILYVLASFSSRVTMCPPVCTGDNPVQCAAVSGPQRPGHLSQTQTAPVSLSACLSTFTCTILYVLDSSNSRVTTCPPVCTGNNPVQHCSRWAAETGPSLADTDSTCLSVFLSIYLHLYTSVCTILYVLDSSNSRVTMCPPVCAGDLCSALQSVGRRDQAISLKHRQHLSVCLPVYLPLPVPFFMFWTAPTPE